MTTSTFLRVPRLVLCAALSAAVLSCADTGPTGEALEERSDELFANDKTIYEYFVGKGLKNYQAAGIVGNLDQESGGNPKAVQSGGPGRGIAQWSVGGRWDHDAGDNLKAFAAKEGKSIYDLGVQLDFVWFELSNFPGYGLAKLKASTNVTDAVIAFQDKYEGCGQCEQGNRVTYAKAVLNAYGSTPPPAYAASFVSQTYPYAAVGPVKIVSGQTAKGKLVMKNTGTATWTKGKTKLAPIPRDKPSAFAASSWLSTTRVSTVSADVPPGKEGTFEWDLEGGKPGDYSPFFGFVEEGVTWFADAPKGGGPEDNVVQVHIVVEAAPPTGAGGSGGAAGKSGAGGAQAAGAAGAPGPGGQGGESGEGGEAGASAGSGDEAGAAGEGGAAGLSGSSGQAGSPETGGTEAAAGSTLAGGAGVGHVDLHDATESSGGCALVVLPRSAPGPWSLGAVAALAIVARRRSRR